MFASASAVALSTVTLLLMVTPLGIAKEASLYMVMPQELEPTALLFSKVRVPSSIIVDP